MNFERTFIVITAVVFFGIGSLAAVRGRRELLAARLAALTIDLFGYEVCELLSRLQPGGVWDALSSAFGNMAIAFGIHFVVTFLGQDRKRRLQLAIVYAYFALLAVVTIASVSGWPQPNFPDSPLWASLTLGGMIPLLVIAIASLVRHVRQTQSEERVRTQMTLAAIALGFGGAATDLASITAQAGPRLSNWGLLGCALMLGAVALRVKILEGINFLVGFVAVGLAGFGVLAQVAVFEAFGRISALLFLGTLLVTFMILAAARHIVRTYTEDRDRREYHENLGRLAAQMAHDIRNPVAVIKGWAQVLLTDAANGAPLKIERLEDIVKQANKITEQIDNYQRIGKVELRYEDVDASDLVQSIAKSARVQWSKAKIEARTNGAIPCRLDPDIVSTVMENLVRNSVEATDGKGTITISAAAEDDRVVLLVDDDGPGMDVRQRERVLRGFVTTKAKGSGLGLMYGQHVAEAHRGKFVFEILKTGGIRAGLMLPLS